MKITAGAVYSINGKPGFVSRWAHYCPSARQVKYCLKVRGSDSEEWSGPEYFRTRKQRDSAASMSRIIGGFRTHSYEEKIDAETLESIDFV